MKQETEDKINELMHTYGKNTISSLLDHLLDIAVSDPHKFDYIQPQDSSEERFHELQQILKQEDNALLNRITNLEKQVMHIDAEIQALKELLAIGLPAVKNHLNNLNKEEQFFNEETEEF